MKKQRLVKIFVISMHGLTIIIAFILLLDAFSGGFENGNNRDFYNKSLEGVFLLSSLIAFSDTLRKYPKLRPMCLTLGVLIYGSPLVEVAMDPIFAEPGHIGLFALSTLCLGFIFGTYWTLKSSNQASLPGVMKER